MEAEGPIEQQQIRDELIFSVFQAAMSRPEREREEFLRETCSTDPALLRHVQRRVQWEARLNGFLLTPVLARDRMDRAFADGEVLLGRFRILRVAGEGGMGVVYEAYDQKLGNRIALKCPRFEFRKRISPEAMKSLRVTHPNVCRVFEVHTAETNTGEIDFLTMEFLEGETLAARLATAPAGWLETEQGLEIARQICAGLQAVHNECVVHKDLKPGNIMLSTDAAGKPRVVLMDFGIAQGADIFSSQVRGTPAYIAPELWKGQPATVQSDVYALGVILHQMARGTLPFAEGAHWKSRLEALPRVEGIGDPERAAILRCIDPDPLKRFQQVSELEAVLTKSRRPWLRKAIFGGVFAACLLVGALVLFQYIRVVRRTLPAGLRADYQQGMYYARFDYQNAANAIPYFEKVIREAPQSPLGYLGLAEAYLGVTGDKTVVGKAQLAVAQAESLDPDLAQVHYMKGRLDVKMHWYEPALEELRRAARIDPKDSEILIEMAYAHYGLKQYPEAEADLNKAIAVEPESYKPHVDAGYYYSIQGNATAAERHWLTAIRMAPQQLGARLDLAELYISQGRLAEATQQVEESLKIRKTADTLDKLGALREQTGKPREAIAAYEEALRIGPPPFTTWARLGAVYRQVHRSSEAMGAFHKGLELSERGMVSYPREPHWVAWCAFYHANLGEDSLARTRAAEAWKMASPEQVDIRRLLVLTYDRIGDRDSALRLLKGAPKDLLTELARPSQLSHFVQEGSRHLAIDAK